MRRVLVIGRESYIGRSFACFVRDRLTVEFAGARDGSWQALDFAGFSAVLLAAGLAHRRAGTGERNLYLAVNRDLPLAAAEKAKGAGVGQFIFLSSASVYGHRQGEINARTPENPADVYGLSKLMAERALAGLADETFRVAVLRPPMVYGPGCPGNFPRLAALVRWLPVFPDRPNRRSLIYIDNLCRLLQLIVEHGVGGLICPQNEDYASTPDLVLEMARALGRKVRLTRLLNPAVSLLRPLVPAAEKLFGDLYYEQNLSFDNGLPSYNVVGFAESIRRSLSGDWQIQESM
jgi:UDP-glucose 4-epimerase